MPSHSNRSTQTLQLHEKNFIISGSLTFVAMITRHQGRGMQEFSSFQSWLIFNLLIYRIYAYFHLQIYAIQLEKHDLVLPRITVIVFGGEKTWRLNILGIFGQAIGPQCRTVGLVCGGKACCRQLLTRRHRQLWVRLYASRCVKFVHFPTFLLLKHWNLAHYDTNLADLLSRLVLPNLLHLIGITIGCVGIQNLRSSGKMEVLFFFAPKSNNA